LQRIEAVVKSFAHRAKPMASSRMAPRPLMATRVAIFVRVTLHWLTRSSIGDR
jgi:hypothetical protein